VKTRGLVAILGRNTPDRYEESANSRQSDRMFGTEIVTVNDSSKRTGIKPAKTKARTMLRLIHAGLDRGLGEPDGIRGADVHPDAFEPQPMQPPGLCRAVELPGQ